MALRYNYDQAVDALYVALAEKPYAYGRDLDPERRIDYAADGTPVGIEITCVMSGVHLDDLPDAKAVEQILHDLGAPIVA